jgi:hypothetical protein
MKKRLLPLTALQDDFMKLRMHYLLVVITVLFAIGAGWLGVVIFGWPPIIIRDSHYHELISDFHQAQPVVKSWRGDENAGWEFRARAPEGQPAAWVRGPSQVGVVTVKYDDEVNVRALYRYVDYTSPVEVKIKANVLYVHWVETLFRANHYLLAYDLTRRREITRRRIDPNDRP